MSSQFDSIILNGKSLRPAPFVSTTYEYAKYNNYTIGGLLIVTLSGTLIGKDIVAQIAELNSLQGSTDCVSLTIGCSDSGGTDFLDGAGRIRSVDVNYDNQPFIASYTMVIEIETISGQPAVEPDPAFAISIGVSPSDVPKFLLDYSENISVDGNTDLIGSHDGGMQISKSNIKGSGSIRIKVSGRSYICGYPSYDPNKAIDKFLKARSQSMINGAGSLNPLSSYSDWSKWLDTKGLEITNNGDASWKFDLYMIPSGGFTPIALVDATSNDKLDQRTNKRTRSINGSIKGLSLATIGDHLGHKTNTNERIGNADSVFQSLEGYLKYGTWPGNNAVITSNDNCPPPANVCVFTPLPVCYQRGSHTVTRSVITGEISFSMEFLDIDACKPLDYSLEITIDESFPANSISEIIIPNRTKKGYHLYSRSIIQKIYTTPRKVTITIRATLNGCDTTKYAEMITVVCCRLAEIINLEFPSFAGWFYKDQKENVGIYSYSVTHERIKCDIII